MQKSLLAVFIYLINCIYCDSFLYSLFIGREEINFSTPNNSETKTEQIYFYVPLGYQWFWDGFSISIGFGPGYQKNTIISENIDSNEVDENISYIEKETKD